VLAARLPSSVVLPRAIFFGTPEFAVPSLLALCEVADVALVVTQPDRQQGRGMKLASPAVKLAAQERGIEVIQPTKVRTPEFSEHLRRVRAEFALVVAYGRILPRAVLQAPKLGCVNVHGSLLPKLRGAAPIQWAIVRGEARTGVCLMQMDEGMDEGPVLACEAVAIGAEETAGELSELLAGLGARLVREQLPRFLRGELVARPQDHAQATLAPILQKEHGRVQWERGATELHNLVRGMHPWPGAYTFLAGLRVKLHRTRVVAELGVHGEPGCVVRADRHGIEIACGTGVLALDELQPEGKKRMNAEQFCAGMRPKPGMRFTNASESG
jgi:methionyl-tRNA formyltransferase